jgi:hypothetical protein
LNAKFLVGEHRVRTNRIQDQPIVIGISGLKPIGGVFSEQNHALTEF